MTIYINPPTKTSSTDAFNARNVFAAPLAIDYNNNQSKKKLFSEILKELDNL